MAVFTTDLTGSDPIVRRRRLCQHLVHLRGARTQQSVADALDWSRSKLIRIENGRIGISPSDLRSLLAHYQVTNTALVEMLIHMARETRHPSPSPFSDVLAPQMIYYLRFEAAASSIRQYHPYLVPGLLQTEEYATAVITAMAERETPEDVLKRQIQARLSRQSALRGARAHFILDESALRRGPFSPGVDHAHNNGEGGLMARQIQHLVALAKRDNITIRVLPFGAGLLRGAQWPFVLLDFADAESDSLLYLEGRDTRVTRDDPGEITRHRSAFDELAPVAVPVAELYSQSGWLRRKD